MFFATAESRVSMNILPPCSHGLSGVDDSITHHPSFSCFYSCFIWRIRGHLRCIGNCTVFLSLLAQWQHVLQFFSTPSTIPHVPLLMPSLFSACFLSSHDRCISLHILFLMVFHVNLFSTFLIPSFFPPSFVHYFLFLVDATLTSISPYA